MKYTPSPAANVISATGTSRPSTWQRDLPNWILAMSAIDGSSVHPDLVVLSSMFTGAPQVGQLVSVPAEVCLQ